MDQSSLVRFIASACRAVGVRGGVSLLVTTDAEMKKLNQYFRNKSQTTDVLSFRAEQYRGQKMVGDLAISAKIARENAHRLGHSFLDEIKVLVLHGILHLAGYDHETDSGEMAIAEHKLRKKLHLPDSLIERNGDTMKSDQSTTVKKKTPIQATFNSLPAKQKRGKKRLQ